MEKSNDSVKSFNMHIIEGKFVHLSIFFLEFLKGFKKES